MDMKAALARIAELEKAAEAKVVPVRVKGLFLGDTNADGTTPCKGLIGIYGINIRTPITVFPEQLPRLFAPSVVADAKALVTGNVRARLSYRSDNGYAKTVEWAKS